MALTRKFFYTSIFTSNHFRTSDAQRERERESERARRESTGDRPAQIVPPPPLPPSPRSHRLTAQKEERVESLLAHDRSRHKESRDRPVEIVEKLMASFLPPKLWSLPSLQMKLMAPITSIWRDWIVGLWPESRWWWGSVVWVLGLWPVADCGVLIGLWTCGGFVDSHCWCGWVVEVDLWWCWLFFF